MRREPVESEAIASIGYEPGSRTLEIEFVSGEVYRYLDVDESVFAAFRAAQSKGTFFQASIRGAFAYSRVTSARRRE